MGWQLVNALHNTKGISVTLTNVPNVTRMLAVIMGTVFVWRDGLVMDKHAHPKEAHPVHAPIHAIRILVKTAASVLIKIILISVYAKRASQAQTVS